MVTALVLAALVGSSAACVGGGKGTQAPETIWPSWQVLGPLARDAQHHIDEESFAAMERAARYMAEGNAKAADAELQLAAAGASPHWIAVARADLAALHFSRCIRGVAWRLPEAFGEMRSIDFDPATKIAEGDVSVEALLTKLDAAIVFAEQKNSTALLRHGRIARARVAGFTAQCAPNEEVAAQAGAVLQADLAVLAAQGELTPDLAYMWAGVQYESYSPQAARPFLLQAKSEGFEDPSVDLLLASIALDANDLEEAETRASAAEAAYAEYETPPLRARALALRGEARRRRKDADGARADFEQARKLDPLSIEALLGSTRMRATDGERTDAVAYLQEGIMGLLASVDASPEAMASGAGAVEALIVNLNDDLAMAELCRDALLREVDLDEAQLRRGLRYYFAATLDVALGDYDAGRGHAAAAETEFEGLGLAAPEGVEMLLRRLDELSR